MSTCKKGHFDGDKKGGEHTSIIEGADQLVQRLRDRKEVGKIVPCAISFIGPSLSGRKRLIVDEANSGATITYLNTLYKQVIFVKKRSSVTFAELFRVIIEEYQATLHKHERDHLVYTYCEFE
jgi:hypothetical protein